MNFLARLTLISLLFTTLGCKENKEHATQTPSETTTSPRWTVIGPGGGGGVLLPTVSPFDDQLVLTHCDMTGAYISYDGGGNWRMFNLWTVPTDFEFDPVGPNTIYTATRGYRHSEDRGSGLSMLFRSEDRGKRWKIIYPDISKAKQVTELQSTDLLPSQIIPGTLDGSIDIVQADPEDHRHIFLGLSPLQSYIGAGNANKEQKKAMLVHSTDYGNSWTLIAGLEGKTVLGIFPGKAGNLQDHVVVVTDLACLNIDINTGRYESFPLPASKIRSAS